MYLNYSLDDESELAVNISVPGGCPKMLDDSSRNKAAGNQGRSLYKKRGVGEIKKGEEEHILFPFKDLTER